MQQNDAGRHWMAFGVLGIRLQTLTMVLCGAALGLAVSSSAAFADFRVCNATQSLVGVAIGYRSKAGWITEGWWPINPSNCKTLIEGPLSSRYYYVYAEDAQRGGRWEGAINMCVGEKEFKVVGINDCFARGFQRVGFQEYDTGEQSSWMVQLTEEPATEPSTSPGNLNSGATQNIAPNTEPSAEDPNKNSSTNP